MTAATSDGGGQRGNVLAAHPLDQPSRALVLVQVHQVGVPGIGGTTCARASLTETG